MERENISPKKKKNTRMKHFAVNKEDTEIKHISPSQESVGNFTFVVTKAQCDIQCTSLLACMLISLTISYPETKIT